MLKTKNTLEISEDLLKYTFIVHFNSATMDSFERDVSAG